MREPDYELPITVQGHTLYAVVYEDDGMYVGQAELSWDRGATAQAKTVEQVLRDLEEILEDMLDLWLEEQFK